MRFNYLIFLCLLFLINCTPIISKEPIDEISNDFSNYKQAKDLPTKIDFDDNSKFEKKDDYSFNLKIDDVDINITSTAKYSFVTDITAKEQQKRIEGVEWGYFDIAKEEQEIVKFNKKIHLTSTSEENDTVCVENNLFNEPTLCIYYNLSIFKQKLNKIDNYSIGFSFDKDLDPTVIYLTLESHHLSVLDNETVIASWCDESKDDIIYQIYNINGTNLTGVITVDSSIGSCAIRQLVSTTAINSTSFVIAYVDENEDDTSWEIWNKYGQQEKTQQDIFTSNSVFVSVNMINSTHFMFVAKNGTNSAQQLTYGYYNIDGTLDYIYNADDNTGSVPYFNFITTQNTSLQYIFYMDTINAIKLIKIEDKIPTITYYESLPNQVQLSIVEINNTHILLSYEKSATSVLYSIIDKNTNTNVNYTASFSTNLFDEAYNTIIINSTNYLSVLAQQNPLKIFFGTMYYFPFDIVYANVTMQIENSTVNIRDSSFNNYNYNREYKICNNRFSFSYLNATGTTIFTTVNTNSLEEDFSNCVFSGGEEPPVTIIEIFNSVTTIINQINKRRD
jgi:hypothetical protein